MSFGLSISDYGKKIYLPTNKVFMLTPGVDLCEKWQGQKVYMDSMESMNNFNCEVCYMSGLSMWRMVNRIAEGAYQLTKPPSRESVF